jgi:hypothetical protein
MSPGETSKRILCLRTLLNFWGPAPILGLMLVVGEHPGPGRWEGMEDI